MTPSRPAPRPGFRRTVLEHLSDVDYGSYVSFAQLAAEVGNPRGPYVR
jgi:O6-methylguanine-DNA--protein-cysteine methyltransferase